MQNESEPDLFFIRHGESTKNEAAHKYQVEHNMVFDWDLFMKDPVFLKTVIYNPTHIDCHLSNQGREEVLFIICSVLRLVSGTKILSLILFLYHLFKEHFKHAR